MLRVAIAGEFTTWGLSFLSFAFVAGIYMAALFAGAYALNKIANRQLAASTGDDDLMAILTKRNQHRAIMFGTIMVVFAFVMTNISL